MKGFDAQYTGLTDYILKCTAQIWEGRDIAALDWHYADNLLVRTPDGINRGNAVLPTHSCSNKRKSLWPSNINSSMNV